MDRLYKRLGCRSIAAETQARQAQSFRQSQNADTGQQGYMQVKAGRSARFKKAQGDTCGGYIHIQACFIAYRVVGIPFLKRKEVAPIYRGGRGADVAISLNNILCTQASLPNHLSGVL